MESLYLLPIVSIIAFWLMFNKGERRDIKGKVGSIASSSTNMLVDTTTAGELGSALSVFEARAEIIVKLVSLSGQEQSALEALATPQLLELARGISEPATK